MTAPRHAGRSRRSLLGSIGFAVALVLLLVVFRAPLVGWFTGKSAAGRAGGAVTVRAGPFSVRAALDPDPPRQQGEALALEIADAKGAPVSGARIEAGYDMPAMGAMSEMKGAAKVVDEKDGRYRAEFDLPMEGTWTLEVSIHAPQGSGSGSFTMTVGQKGLNAAGTAPMEPPASIAPRALSGSPAVQTTYPDAAYDALRSALDGYDRIRRALAHDSQAGVAAEARAAAEALRAAASASDGGPSGLASSAKRASDDAERVAGAASLGDARKAFAALSGDLLGVVAADARLTADRHVFRCPMFEGRPLWMQRAAKPENPYLGTTMPACGTDVGWSPAPPEAGQGVVTIDEAHRQLVGVRTGPVVAAPMQRRIRAVGVVSYDESGLGDVNLKVRGWITSLQVSRTGERVARGQPLFTLYSPELYNAQQDFLVAVHGATGGAGGPGDALAQAARKRLRLLGMTDVQIDELARRGTPSESVAFTAPTTGFVVEKNAVEGAAVEAGTRVYRIAALDRVWVEADVYESDLAHVRAGQRAVVTLDYLPGRSYDAKVSYVYPYLDDKTRTGRVRIELANADFELRPGMYASVELASDLGTRVQVPVGAVVYAGPRRLVFVDLGQGRFRPQEVQVGVESDGMYEVLSGVNPGDRVAVSGAFLIAADARIRTAATYWDDAPQSAPDGAP